MGEKGSIKNRIKDFFKIRKNLLKKKEKEQKLLKEKNKQYSKPRIFFTILASYLLTVITYPFTKKSSNKQTEIKKLENIEIKLEIVETIEELNRLELETNNIKKELIIDKKLDIKLNKRTKQLLEKIDEKKEKIKSQDTQKKIVENIKVDIERVVLVKNINQELNVIEKKLQGTKDLKEIEKIDKRLKELKYTNKYNLDVQIKIDKLNEKVQNLNNKIKASLNKKDNNIQIEKNLEKEKSREVINKKVVPSLIVTGALGAHLVAKVGKEIIESARFQNHEEDFNKQEQSEVEEIIIEYEKNNNDLNESNIEESEKEFVENNNLDTINKKEKLMIVNQKKEQNVEEKNKKEQRKNNLSNRLEEFYVSLNDIKTAHELVETELEKQNLELEQIHINLLKIEPKKRKRSLLTTVGKKILDLSIGLSPLALFKNKLVGGLVSSVLLNHQVKKTRKIIKYEGMEYYYNIKILLKQIVDKKDAIIKTLNINLDTISEIELLKDDILKEIEYDFDKYPEVFNIINNLNKRKEKLEEKNKQLQKELEKTKELEKRGKTKIKTFNK